MDPLERADVLLARARARGTFVVTPESAISPMDAANTLQIPRAVVSANDGRRDPDSTLQVPVPVEPNVPAIAQETFTDVVASPPGIRSRQRRIDDARARNNAQQQTTELEVELATSAQRSNQEGDGPIPTTQQPPTGTGSLSQRLDG